MPAVTRAKKPHKTAIIVLFRRRRLSVLRSLVMLWMFSTCKFTSNPRIYTPHTQKIAPRIIFLSPNAQKKPPGCFRSIPEAHMSDLFVNRTELVFAYAA